MIARDAEKLRDKGINLVINLSPNEVKTNPCIYEPYDIKYYPIYSEDNVFTCLINVVDVVVDLIEEAIQDGGKYRIVSVWSRGFSFCLIYFFIFYNCSLSQKSEYLRCLAISSI